jgi:streptogramin lyase
MRSSNVVAICATACIAASDSTVWIGGDGSGGPTLRKIDATSSPTAYVVKAAVAPVNQRPNRVLIGNGAIWFLVSNGTETYEVNPSNPASSAPALVVYNGSDTGEMAMDANNLCVLDSYGHLYSVRQNGFPNVTPSTARTAGFAAPIHVDGNGIYLLPAHGSKQISVVDSTKLTVTSTIGTADSAISAVAATARTSDFAESRSRHRPRQRAPAVVLFN